MIRITISILNGMVHRPKGCWIFHVKSINGWYLSPSLDNNRYRHGALLVSKLAILTAEWNKRRRKKKEKDAYARVLARCACVTTRFPCVYITLGAARKWGESERGNCRRYRYILVRVFGPRICVFRPQRLVYPVPSTVCVLLHDSCPTNPDQRKRESWKYSFEFDQQRR